MDVLSDAIAVMRMGIPHSSRTLQAAPWGLRFLPSGGAGFHVVLQGSCWLLPPAGEPVRLSAGDVVFMPNGRGHGLSDSLATPLVDVPPAALVEFGTTTSDDSPLADSPPPFSATNDSGPTTLLLCGAYKLDHTLAHPLVQDLPDVVHLPAGVGQHPSLKAAVDMLGGELEARRPGADAVVTALLDVLLLYALRAWFELAPPGGARKGWAEAITDPTILAALRCMHGDPARAWTVEALGAEVGLSRAAFARRFAGLTGQPPLAYLTWWRMVVARRLLRGSDESLDAVAAKVGYTSEFAFAKAFKRAHGLAPGRYRRGD